MRIEINFSTGCKNISVMPFLKRKWVFFAMITFFLFFWVSLPQPLFKDPTCTIVEDQDGILIGARIASDGQWRFPAAESVPYKFEKALVTFEDRYFYFHNGINPVSTFRAVIQDIRAGKIVSGGSTITMQVIRLARKGRDRTVFEKIIEAFLAVRLELTYKKSEILALYAANAPFGGNIVGLQLLHGDIMVKHQTN